MLDRSPSKSFCFGLALALALVLGCDATKAPSAVTQPEAAEHDELGDQLAALDDPQRRDAALASLRQQAFEADEHDDTAALERLEATLLPALTNRWQTASANERLTGLTIALYLATPAAEALWTTAIGQGNPDEVALALEGVTRAHAWACGAAMLDRLESELADVKEFDDTRASMVMRLIATLGDARHRDAVEPLIRLLDGVEQPRPIQREIISALGRIGDPRAVDALLAVQFHVPDAPGTQSVGERALRAIAAIGEPALPAVLMTFAGNNGRVNALADEVGVSQEIIANVMARALGIIGSTRATGPLLDAFPRAGCKGTPASRDELERMSDRSTRMFYANALGFIADPTAVETLCSCSNSPDPGELYELVAALGRTGGQQAADCLGTIVRNGRADPLLVDEGMELEIRWEGFRWAVIATPPDSRAALTQLLASMPADIRAEIERRELARGLVVLDACANDMSCYADALADAKRHPYERELAAFVLARAATPGDVELAAAIASAFATPDPAVRVNMAWLAGKVAGGRACPGCIAALDEIMRAEDLTKTADMQAAWITARQTIDKAHAGQP